uniref:Uncharacterized protein n=1 Tax=Anguilla anguilla TaxID=7936 RepID=A0A0E9QYI0_ANGAN
MRDILHALFTCAKQFMKTQVIQTKVFESAPEKHFVNVMFTVNKTREDEDLKRHTGKAGVLTQE